MKNNFLIVIINLAPFETNSFQLSTFVIHLLCSSVEELSLPPTQLITNDQFFLTFSSKQSSEISSTIICSELGLLFKLNKSSLWKATCLNKYMTIELILVFNSFEKGFYSFSIQGKRIFHLPLIWLLLKIFC